MEGAGRDLGIDIGGTKIAAALVEGDRLASRAETPTPVGRGSEAVAAAVTAVIGDATAWCTPDRVGIACAGPIDGTHVAPLNVEDWRGFDVVSLVAITLPGVPIQLVGDAIAMTAAEHRYGAAAPYQCAMCVTVSTGVGAGLIVHNQVVLGGTGNAGHLGHMVVDLDGAECVCGGRGCVEAFAGGTTMVRWAQSQGWRHPAPTVAALAADACRGDDVARDTFERAGRAIGAAVASVAALIEIQAAVIGGGVARAGELLLEPIRRHLHAYARLAFIGNVDIVPAALGGDAGLIGAALVARETDGVRVC